MLNAALIRINLDKEENGRGASCYNWSSEQWKSKRVEGRLCILMLENIFIFIYVFIIIVIKIRTIIVHWYKGVELFED